MARAMADGDTHMEDQGLGMEEPGHSPTIVTYHSDTLLAPNADFMADDRSSAASGMDVVDRLTYLEQRMQMQEDEIQLLKMALADVLKRLNISEEQQAAGRRPSTGLKAARPVSLTLPSKPATAGPSAAPPKKNATLPSASRTQNYTAAPTTSKSAVKSPTDSLKDSSKPKPAAAPTCKKPHDSSKAAKEPGVIVGSRRVTHCKVTMQIYLSPLTRRTGSSESARVAPTVPTPRPAGPPPAPQAPGAASNDRVRLDTCKTTPDFTLPLKKTPYTQMDTLNYKSPIKSPGQYFQICY